jgi:hypothetical protein
MVLAVTKRPPELDEEEERARGSIRLLSLQANKMREGRKGRKKWKMERWENE